MTGVQTRLRRNFERPLATRYQDPTKQAGICGRGKTAERKELAPLFLSMPWTQENNRLNLSISKVEEFTQTELTIFFAVFSCGPPPTLNFATLVGSRYTYQQNVTYTCVSGRWFGNGVFQLDATCSENRTWVPKLPNCEGS